MEKVIFDSATLDAIVDNTQVMKVLCSMYDTTVVSSS